MRIFPFLLFLCFFQCAVRYPSNALPPSHITYTSSRIFWSFHTPYRVCQVPAESDSNSAYSVGAIASRRQNGVAVPQRACARCRIACRCRSSPNTATEAAASSEQSCCGSVSGGVPVSKVLTSVVSRLLTRKEQLPIGPKAFSVRMLPLLCGTDRVKYQSMFLF